MFCITKLWTDHIKKFEHAPNHFVPNVLSVKNTPWNPCIAFLSDPLFNFNMAQHVFLSKKFRKNLKSFCFCEVNYFGTEKWKKNALEKMLNWKRQFFFDGSNLSLEESFWRSIIQATHINKQNWRVPFLRFTIPCFWVSGSLNQASMQTFQEDWKNYFERYLFWLPLTSSCAQGIFDPANAFAFVCFPWANLTIQRPIEFRTLKQI